MGSHIHKIQDNNFSYQLLKKYVDFSLFQAYRKIEYLGLENIPKDGSIIYAPNHTNALMDALIVLSMADKPIVFVARADIFKNKVFAKILNFLKIMPIMRIRDGIDEVKKNNETIDKSVDVLMDNVPFCILPEGTHRAQHSLLPLSKGIFRIAIQAYQKMEGKRPLYIVPLGLEYGNFFRFRSTILLQVGRPINIGDFLSSYPDESQPEIINKMKDTLSDRLKEVILYIPDDDNYEATYEICSIVINEQVTEYLKDNPKEKRLSLTTRLNSNKITVSEIENARKTSPEIVEELFKKGAEIRAKRLKSGISLGSIIMKNPFWSRFLKMIILLLTMPYTIVASILALPVSAITRIILKKMKDEAFFNSVRFVITLVVWPFMLIIYSIVLFSTLPWEVALLSTLVIFPANMIAQDCFRLLRLRYSDAKLLYNLSLRKEIKDLKRFYFQNIKTNH